MTKLIPRRLSCSDILSDIKETVVEAKEEYQKKLEENSRERVYKRILDEAVILIRKMWLYEAKDEKKIKNLGDSIEVSANAAILITDELKVYSEYGNMAFNPETKRCCFFDVFTFESEEEKDQYIKAVIERLPEGTECEVADYMAGWGAHCRTYTFKLKVDIQ